jgi:acetoin utilization deacetylase AcuC-like enzyme
MNLIYAPTCVPQVHWGNGTQRTFEADPSVLYFSVHRFDKGYFYPCDPKAGPGHVGVGAGKGFNMNVAWNNEGDKVKPGDDDYLEVWRELLIPVATEFRPDLILISAGFDAAQGDPLGKCNITPEGYALMTSQLLQVCPKVVLVLEGGYNLRAISSSFAACTSVLLGQTPEPVPLTRPLASSSCSIEETLQHHKPYWSVLRQDQETTTETTDEPHHRTHFPPLSRRRVGSVYRTVPLFFIR